jgi:hypothetical protein
MTRTLLLFLLTSISAFSQIFSAGVKAGVPLTDFLDAAQTNNIKYFTHTNRYIVGPAVEIHLPFGLGIEADALYRHLNYQQTSTGITTTSASATSNAWEFPLLVKYRFPIKLIHPFVDAGMAFDSLQGLKETVTVATSTSSTSHPSELQHSTTKGVVIGGGLNIRLLVIHIMPEIRYTHWGEEHFTVGGLLHSNVNQGEFLLGIQF